MLDVTSAAMWILLLLVVIVIFMLCSNREHFQDDLYGQGSTSCKEICTEQHPQAARMDLDADNSIADQVMGQCMKECRQAKGCSTCA